VELTAASTVVVGGLCLLLAAVEAAIPALLAGLPDSGALDDPSLRAMRDAFVSGARSSALWNAAFGIALVAIGIGVGRLARWSHPAMTVAAWGSIAALAAIAKPSLAPLAALAGNGRTGQAIVWAGGGALLAAQAGAVLWFLRFWRSDGVRELFNASGPGRPDDRRA